MWKYLETYIGLAVLAFVAWGALHALDRIITGMVQCEATQTCPRSK